MSNDTKATISILSVALIAFLFFVVFQYFDYMLKKQESLASSYNANEEIYCSKDNNWTIVSKSQDWKLVGYHFVKENVTYEFGNCEKNNKETTNANPKRN